MIAIAAAAANGDGRVSRPAHPAVSKTAERLGYDPIALDAGLKRLVDWLRELGRID